MWKADLLSYRGEMNFIRAYQGNSLVWERPLKNNVIYYTVSDGGSITPYYPDHFGDAVIVSNKYEDGLGVITFDRSVTIIGERAFTSNSRIESVVIPSSVVHIGGFAFGETSTKSRPASSARAQASKSLITPLCSPFSSITRTSCALICLLIRKSLVAN